MASPPGAVTSPASSAQTSNCVFIKNERDCKSFKLVTKQDVSNLTGTHIDRFLTMGVKLADRYRVTFNGRVLTPRDTLGDIGITQSGESMMLEFEPFSDLNAAGAGAAASPTSSTVSTNQQQQHMMSSPNQRSDNTIAPSAGASDSDVAAGVVAEALAAASAADAQHRRRLEQLSGTQSNASPLPPPSPPPSAAVNASVAPGLAQSTSPAASPPSPTSSSPQNQQQQQQQQNQQQLHSAEAVKNAARKLNAITNAAIATNYWIVIKSLDDGKKYKMVSRQNIVDMTGERVKKFVAVAAQVPEHEQLLRFHKVIIGDDDTLKDKGVVQGSTLSLRRVTPQQMQAYVAAAAESRELSSAGSSNSAVFARGGQNSSHYSPSSSAAVAAAAAAGGGAAASGGGGAGASSSTSTSAPQSRPQTHGSSAAFSSRPHTVDSAGELPSRPGTTDDAAREATDAEMQRLFFERLSEIKDEMYSDAVKGAEEIDRQHSPQRARSQPPPTSAGEEDESAALANAPSFPSASLSQPRRSSTPAGGDGGRSVPQTFIFISNERDKKRYKFVSKRGIGDVTADTLDRFLVSGAGIREPYRVLFRGREIMQYDSLRMHGVEHGNTLQLEMRSAESAEAAAALGIKVVRAPSFATPGAARKAADAAAAAAETGGAAGGAGGGAGETTPTAAENPTAATPNATAAAAAGEGAASSSTSSPGGISAGINKLAVAAKTVAAATRDQKTFFYIKNMETKSRLKFVSKAEIRSIRGSKLEQFLAVGINIRPPYRIVFKDQQIFADTQLLEAGVEIGSTLLLYPPSSEDEAAQMTREREEAMKRLAAIKAAEEAEREREERAKREQEKLEESTRLAELSPRARAREERRALRRFKAAALAAEATSYFVIIKDLDTDKRYKFVSKSNIAQFTGIRVKQFLNVAAQLDEDEQLIRFEGQIIGEDDILSDKGVYNGCTLTVRRVPPDQMDVYLTLQTQASMSASAMSGNFQSVMSSARSADRAEDGDGLAASGSRSGGRSSIPSAAMMEFAAHPSAVFHSPDALAKSISRARSDGDALALSGSGSRDRRNTSLHIKNSQNQKTYKFVSQQNVSELTGAKIKHFVMVATGNAMEDQLIRFNGLVVGDSERLSDFGIVHNSVLHLEIDKFLHRNFWYEGASREEVENATVSEVEDELILTIRVSKQYLFEESCRELEARVTREYVPLEQDARDPLMRYRASVGAGEAMQAVLMLGDHFDDDNEISSSSDEDQDGEDGNFNLDNDSSSQGDEDDEAPPVATGFHLEDEEEEDEDDEDADENKNNQQKQSRDEVPLYEQQLAHLQNQQNKQQQQQQQQSTPPPASRSANIAAAAAAGGGAASSSSAARLGTPGTPGSRPRSREAAIGDKARYMIIHRPGAEDEEEKQQQANQTEQQQQQDQINNSSTASPIRVNSREHPLHLPRGDDRDIYEIDHSATRIHKERLKRRRRKQLRMFARFEARRRAELTQSHYVVGLLRILSEFEDDVRGDFMDEEVRLWGRLVSDEAIVSGRLHTSERVGRRQRAKQRLDDLVERAKSDLQQEYERELEAARESDFAVCFRRACNRAHEKLRDETMHLFEAGKRNTFRYFNLLSNQNINSNNNNNISSTVATPNAASSVYPPAAAAAAAAGGGAASSAAAAAGGVVAHRPKPPSAPRNSSNNNNNNNTGKPPSSRSSRHRKSTASSSTSQNRNQQQQQQNRGPLGTTNFMENDDGSDSDFSLGGDSADANGGGGGGGEEEDEQAVIQQTAAALAQQRIRQQQQQEEEQYQQRYHVDYDASVEQVARDAEESARNLSHEFANVMMFLRD